MDIQKLDIHELKNVWIDIQPKWNSFLNSDIISLIIIDRESGILYKSGPKESMRAPITTEWLFDEIRDYAAHNTMITLWSNEVLLPESLSWVSNTADIFINPFAIMRLKPGKIKIRTTFAAESIIYLTTGVAFKKMLNGLDKHFDISKNLKYKEAI